MAGLERCKTCGKEIQLSPRGTGNWIHLETDWTFCSNGFNGMAHPENTYYNRVEDPKVTQKGWSQGSYTLKATDKTSPYTDFVNQKDVGTKVDETNPKDLLGDKKVAIGQVLPVALVHEAMAMMDGTWKYGYRNFREKKVQARIYIDAAIRHIKSWEEGEETAEDSNVHHLGHARACLGILLDAQETGNLIDNRVKGVFSKVLKRMEDWVVQRKKLYENKPVPKSATTLGEFTETNKPQRNCRP